MSNATHPGSGPLAAGQWQFYAPGGVGAHDDAPRENHATRFLRERGFRKVQTYADGREEFSLPDGTVVRAHPSLSTWVHGNSSGHVIAAGEGGDSLAKHLGDLTAHGSRVARDDVVRQTVRGTHAAMAGAGDFFDRKRQALGLRGLRARVGR